jgi:hypothetical protein
MDFNGTSIAAGSTVWFNSALAVSGLGSAPVTITFTGQTISYGGASISVPDAKVVFSPTATSATTTFTGGMWVTTVPSKLGGRSFLSGVAVPIPTAIVGSLKGVTWSGTMTSDTKGVTVNWVWAAAAFKSFASAPGGYGIKPVDDPNSSSYGNSDHAGTPESCKGGVTGGAAGGGGSNYTGSYSGTASVAF